MAGVTRLELATFPSSLTGRSNQQFDQMAGVTRLELATSGLTGHKTIFTPFYLPLLNSLNIMLISHCLSFCFFS